MKKLLLTAACLSSFALCQVANATPIVFSAAAGNLAASATFDINSSNNLVVTLTNTSTADVLAPADVLTAVFFSMDGVLTPISAILGQGSTVAFGPNGGGNVGGEWGYKTFSSGAPNNATKGISSSGLSPLFGDPNFNGSNLQNPNALDGLQYGITSAGDNLSTGNSAVTGSNALIKNSVVFTLSGVDLNLSTIDNVSFQYGTSLTEPNITTKVPDGAPTLALVGLGLLGLGFMARRKA